MERFQYQIAPAIITIAGTNAMPNTIRQNAPSLAKYLFTAAMNPTVITVATSMEPIIKVGGNEVHASLMTSKTTSASSFMT